MRGTVLRLFHGTTGAGRYGVNETLGRPQKETLGRPQTETQGRPQRETLGRLQRETLGRPQREIVSGVLPQRCGRILHQISDVMCALLKTNRQVTGSSPAGLQLVPHGARGHQRP